MHLAVCVAGHDSGVLCPLLGGLGLCAFRGFSRGSVAGPAADHNFLAGPVVPPAAGRSDIHMGEACVNTDAAGLWLQVFGVLGYLQRGDAGDHDVCRRTQDVLAVGSTAHLLVVGLRPVCGIDDHSLAKMIPDVLQQGNQLVRDQNLVGTVVALELADLEICGQLFASVGFYRIGFHAHGGCLLFEIYQDQIMHRPGAGDGLPGKIALTGPAAV